MKVCRIDREYVLNEVGYVDIECSDGMIETHVGAEFETQVGTGHGQYSVVKSFSHFDRYEACAAKLDLSKIPVELHERTLYLMACLSSRENLQLYAACVSNSVNHIMLEVSHVIGNAITGALCELEDKNSIPDPVTKWYNRQCSTARDSVGSVRYKDFPCMPSLSLAYSELLIEEFRDKEEVERWHAHQVEKYGL